MLHRLRRNQPLACAVTAKRGSLLHLDRRFLFLDGGYGIILRELPAQKREKPCL